MRVSWMRMLGGSAGALLSGLVLAQNLTLEDICDDCVVEKFAECGGFLEGATIDREGTLWVVDLLTGNILSVDGSGNCEVRGNSGGQPNGAKFHRDGRLFIADKTRGILAFDPRDGSLEQVVNMFRSELLRGTNDLVFDADGGLYFTEPYGSGALQANGRVFYLPPGDNASLQMVQDGLAFPNGIALSANGARVYIGEYARKRITSIPSMTATDPFDTSFVLARTEGGIGPDGMALDADGNVYAAIFEGGGVQVFDARGFPLGHIALPSEGTFTTNLAFGDGAVYITEASRGEIWRIRTSQGGLPLFHQQ